MSRLMESTLTGKIVKILLEEEETLTFKKRICPKCGKTYTDIPAISRYDDTTEICPDCGRAEAFENLEGPVSNPHVYDKFMDKKEDVKESVDDPTPEEIEADEKKLKEDKKKVIENRIGELRQAIADGVADDEKQAMENEINDLESQLNNSSLNEDNYDESIFSEIESALERAGLDVSRYSDVGMMTKNLGWVVSSSEGEVNLTCAGTYLDEAVKTGSGITLVGKINQIATEARQDIDKLDKEKLSSMLDDILSLCDTHKKCHFDTENTVFDDVRECDEKTLKEDSYSLSNEVKEVVQNTFDGTDFTVSGVELGDNGLIRFNVTAYDGENELNRDVEITVPELNYLDAVADACLNWMSEHDSPDSFYESAKINESVTVEAVDGSTVTTDDAASVSVSGTSVSITNGSTTITMTTEDNEPANDLVPEGELDTPVEEPEEEVPEEPTEEIPVEEPNKEDEEIEEADKVEESDEEYDVAGFDKGKELERLHSDDDEYGIDATVEAKSLSVLKNQGDVYMLQIEENNGKTSYWVCRNFNQETNEGENAEVYDNKEAADDDYFDRVGLDKPVEETEE